MSNGMITPPRPPAPPRPVAAILLPPKDPAAAPQWAGLNESFPMLDLGDDTPLTGGSCNLDGPCESCQ